MKNVKKGLSLLCLVLVASSCITLDGRLDVKEAMVAKIKSGFLNRKTKDIIIQPDLYQAELKVNGEKNFTLKLEGRDKILIPIKSEKSFNLPSNGLVTISHQEINQPFDIQGEIRTDTTRSERLHEVVDCTYTVTENHCQKVCDTATRCHVECADVTVAIDGLREIDFHFVTVHRQLHMSLLAVGQNKSLANFVGSDESTSRINDFVGTCR